MKVLVTGAAGFIGHHLSRRLAEEKDCSVLGIDHLGPKGEPALKRARLAALEGRPNFRFVRADFAETEPFARLVADFQPDYVAHLGAETGVRDSLRDPAPYVRNNLDGFASVLEACRRTPPRRLVYASSSSVYGDGARPPFREDDAGEPVSFYGATKKCNEIMARSYARSHGVAAIGLRFFTVYGPWGRPDMAPTLFARAIVEGRPLSLFNQGRNRRDFTYVDDIVDGILGILRQPDPPGLAYSVYNLGHNRPVETLAFVRLLESLLGRTAQIELLPAQAGEMFETCADLSRVRAAAGFSPKVPLEEGLPRFVAWFQSYYGSRAAGAPP